MSRDAPPELGVAARVMERSLIAMRDNSPAEFRKLMADPDWMRTGLEGFYWRLKHHCRDAVRLFFEAQGWVNGRETTLILAFLAGHGLTDESDLARKLEMARAAEDADATMAYRLAKQLVRERVMSDPVERRRAMQEIFGAMEVPANLVQPPALTNGHANGHAS